MTILAAACGPAQLVESLGILGVEVVGADRATIAVIDLRDPNAVRSAAELPSGLQRIVVATDRERLFVDALGFPTAAIASSCEPAVLGPVIGAVLPAQIRRSTRTVVVTAAKGGVGRTLLTANLARRLAAERATLLFDLTGSGDLAWWLGARPSGWGELEGLTEELSAEHLAVIAVDAAPGLRLVGGPTTAPSRALATAAMRVGQELADLVIADAAGYAEARTRALVESADRVLFLTYPDPISVAAMETIDLPENAWLIGSQTGAAVIGGHEVFRALPRSDDAVVHAATGPRAVGGPLGAAYDDLADLLAIDAS